MPTSPPEPSRAERHLPELEPLVGTVKAQRIASVEHMPTAVSLAIGHLLREGAEKGMDRFAFVRAEEERAKLIDHIGGCERILKTPLPEAYSIEIRQFIFVFLVALPFGILLKVDWLTPLVTMLVAFPILALDEIGVELQNPFSQRPAQSPAARRDLRESSSTTSCSCLVTRHSRCTTDPSEVADRQAGRIRRRRRIGQQA